MSRSSTFQATITGWNSFTFTELPQHSNGRASTGAGQGHHAFRTTDFDGDMKKALAAGAEALGLVTLFGSTRAVYLRTPGGTILELEG